MGHLLELGENIVVSGSQHLIPVNQDLFDYGIGQPVSADNYGLGKFLCQPFTLPVKFNYCGKRRARYSGNQAAEIIGKAFRQHGYNPVWEIDTGAALVCFTVQG